MGSISSNNLHRAQFQETVEAKQASYCYKGEDRVISTLEEGYEIHIIDDAIFVKAIKPEIREEKKHFWEKRGVFNFRLGTLGAVESIVASGVLITAASVATLGVAEIIAGVAAIVGGVALAIFGFYTSSQAYDEKAEWEKDKVKSVIEQRLEAHEKGFSYIFEQQLKGSVFHPDEVTSHWQEWAKEFFSTYANQELDAEKIKLFFEKNPLNTSYMNYAGIKESGISHQFQQINRNFKNMVDRFLLEEKQIRDAASAEHKENEDHLNRELKPYKIALDAAKNPHLTVKEEEEKKIEQEYQRKVREKIGKDLQMQEKMQLHDQLSQEKNDKIAQILRAYDAAVAPYEMIYQLTTNPIIDKHEKIKKKIAEMCQDRLKKVEQQKDVRVLGYQELVSNLSQAFFSPEETEYLLNPSAPTSDQIFPSFRAEFEAIKSVPTLPSYQEFGGNKSILEEQYRIFQQGLQFS